MDRFPSGREKRPRELCWASWLQGPAWGVIEMPLEVTPVASGQEVSHCDHSEDITNMALFPIPPSYCFQRAES